MSGTEEKKIDELERSLIELQDALHREQKNNSLKSQFIGTAAHEFRTPLTTILNSADFLGLVGRSCDEEKFREHISKIQRAVTYLADFSEDVLTISKIEISNSSMRPVLFSPEEFCRQIIDEITDGNRMHAVSFRWSGPSDTLFHDKHLLQHIIINLLENAVKYSPGNSPVELSVSMERTHMTVTVKDEGRGIPEEDQKTLFEPFVRGSNNNDTMGTGLGLSIVKKSVDIMKGTIAIHSSLNAGTTVTVRIPLLNNSETAPAV